MASLTDTLHLTQVERQYFSAARTLARQEGTDVEAEHRCTWVHTRCLFEDDELRDRWADKGVPYHTQDLLTSLALQTKEYGASVPSSYVEENVGRVRRLATQIKTERESFRNAS